MKKFLLYSLCAIALVACQKEVKKEQPVAGGAPDSFNVFSPETKTTIDGLSVKWAEGDKIRVYGHNTLTDAYDNGTYTLSSGAGTTAGVFTKDSGEELTGTYDAYYAVYPGGLTPTVNGTTIAFSKLNSSPYHMRNQNPPTGGGFDPNLAIMTAKFNDGKFTFRHGVGYIKVTIPTAGITKVDINLNDDSACLAETPTYNADTGAIAGVSNSSKNVTSATGTFTQGQSYYFAAIPRGGSYHIGEVIVTFTGGATVRTNHFSGKDIEVGKVFDLGTPQVITDPIISASDVNLSSSATNGAITFSVTNSVPGGVMSAAIKTASPSGWLTLGDLTASTVPLTCSANTTGSAKTATVTLTYTYNSTETVTKDVTVTQLSTISKTWDFSDSAWDSQFSAASSARGSNQSSWSVTYDGLTYTSGTKNGKWDWLSTEPNANRYIQPNGSGSATERVFSFTASVAGTLTVYVANPSDPGTGRVVQVKVGTASAVSSTEVVYPDIQTKEFEIEAGEVKIYPNAGLRFFKFTFESN